MKKTKKLLSIAITIIIAVLSIFPVLAISMQLTNQLTDKSFSELSESQLNSYFELAKESVEKYYLAVMPEAEGNSSKKEINYSDSNISPSTDLLSATDKVDVSVLEELSATDTVGSYIDSKLEFFAIHMEELEYTQTYIDGTYEILSWEIVDDYLLCKVSSEVIFQYSNSDTRSGICETFNILLKSPKDPQIIDWYVDESFFDMNVRGFDIDLTKKDDWIFNQDERALEKTEEEHLDSRRKSALLEEQQIEKSEANDLIKSNMSLNLSNTSLKISPTGANITWRNNILNYANKNWPKGSTPSSGGSGVPFFDPGNGLGCTVFVNHCLLAGGFKPQSGTHGVSGWYYKSQSNRSPSWQGVNSLDSFINSNSSSTGPTSSSRTNDIYTSNYANVFDNKGNSGDIVQIKYNWTTAYGYPNYGHSTIITSKSGSSNVRIAWRTDQSSGWNLSLTQNYPLSAQNWSGYGGCLYRLICLKSPG